MDLDFDGVDADMPGSLSLDVALYPNATSLVLDIETILAHTANKEAGRSEPENEELHVQRCLDSRCLDSHRSKKNRMSVMETKKSGVFEHDKDNAQENDSGVRNGGLACRVCGASSKLLCRRCNRARYCCHDHQEERALEESKESAPGRMCSDKNGAEMNRKPKVGAVEMEASSVDAFRAHAAKKEVAEADMEPIV